MRRIVTILMLMLLSACGTSLTQESAELRTPWGGIDAVGPDGRSGRYGVTALNSGDSSVFRPGTTVSALTLYAADPKTKKEVVAPYVIGRAQGATVNTPFGQGVDAFARVSAAALLGPIAALFSPDQGDTNIGGAQVGDVSATGTGGTAYAEQRLSAFLKMQNRFFTNLYGGKGGSVPCKEWGGKGGC